MTYRESARGSVKELELDDRLSIASASLGLALSSFMIFCGVLAVNALIRSKTTMEAIMDLLFIAIGVYGIVIMRSLVLEMLTKVHLLCEDQTLRIEWRRRGKVKKAVDSRRDALSLSLREGTAARSGQKHWSVILGTDGADVTLGGPYWKVADAESRKARLAHFLGLDSTKTTRVRVSGHTEVIQHEPLESEDERARARTQS